MTIQRGNAQKFANFDNFEAHVQTLSKSYSVRTWNLFFNKMTSTRLPCRSLAIVFLGRVQSVGLESNEMMIKIMH